MEFIKKGDKVSEYSIDNNLNNKYLLDFLNHVDQIKTINNDNIIFTVDSIESLKDFTIPIDTEYIRKFIYDIGMQILLLKEKNLGIKYMSITDIVILNSDTFIFINPNMLYNLLDKNDIAINHSINSNEYGIVNQIDLDSKFLPPEYRETKKSSYYYYTTGFYSFAKLLLFVFNLNIENLEDTKLQSFLDRCLKEKPEDRIFLYI
tara:strand:+ start:7186 stop:7800 length:615 start_codon:yes stop_codon:yes gene_type:complete